MMVSAIIAEGTLDVGETMKKWVWEGNDGVVNGMSTDKVYY